MTNSFLKALILPIIGFLMVAPAYAQNCGVTYELIFRLTESQIGSYNVWDTIHGEQMASERFVSGVTEDLSTVVVGEYRAEEGAPMMLTLNGLDRRGRVVWARSHKIGNLDHVVKMLRSQSGYMVVGNKTTSENQHVIWFGYFNKNGDLRDQREIKDSKGDVWVHDIAQAHDGENYVLAATYKKRQAEGFGSGIPAYSVLYKVTPQAKVMASPAYLPGIENQISSITPASEGYYIAAGHVVVQDGRKSGWVMRLNEEGHVGWQQQYPRGAAAALLASSTFVDGYFLVGGFSEPFARTGANTAGWVMALDEDNGSVLWQRYYTGDIHYSVKDMRTNESGLTSAVLNGAPTANVAQEYVRLLTINPRGQIFIGDEYFNGEGAFANQMILGSAGERVLVGETKMKYQIEGQGDHESYELRSLDGWVLAGASSESYTDPCLRKRKDFNE